MGRSRISETQVSGPVRFAWDLDGTLIMTRDANWYAYLHLGVTPPADFHIRPWQEWCTQSIHDQKGDIIGSYLRRYARPTPMLQIFRQTGGVILTNASRPVIRHLTGMFDELRNAEIHSGLRPEQKIEWLRNNEPGVYFDDSESTVQMVRERTRWSAISVQF